MESTAEFKVGDWIEFKREYKVAQKKEYWDDEGKYPYWGIYRVKKFYYNDEHEDWFVELDVKNSCSIAWSVHFIKHLPFKQTFYDGE